MNIIIGHTGYIGSFLLKELIKEDFTILGISRQKISLKNQLKNKNFSEIKFDIFKERIIEKLNFNSKPIIYICAHNINTNFSNKRKSIDLIYNSNKIFYLNFIENIKLLKPKKLIFLSSGGSLYDNTNKLKPSSENSTLNPLSEYGLSKFILERYLINLSKDYQIPLVISRISTIYGNSFSNTKFGFINYLKECSLNNNFPILYGKDTYRDYLNIEDLVKIIIKIGNRDLISSTYNISYGESYSCLEIYNKVKQNLNKSGHQLKRFIDKGSRDGENSKVFISSDRLKNELNWIPKINIDLGIEKFLNEIIN